MLTMLRRLMLLFTLIMTGIAAAAEVSVSNKAELAAALAAAKPGDTIVMANGDWREIDIDLTQAGTEQAPITLKAQTAGNVVITSASSLTFSASYNVVDGLFFHRAVTEKSSLITINADHCRLTNTAVVDSNPPTIPEGYYWVFFNGNHNRMDHCYFEGKTNQQPLVGNQIRNSRHNVTENCFFKDIPAGGGNGREIFRIWGTGGNEELGEDGAFFTIESCLFDHADGERAEIISLKSNHNKVIGNTIVATQGGITNRSGNYNTYINNVILGQNRRGCSGMRLTGQHHVVHNNYIADCSYGIMLVSGEFIESDVTGSYRPINREGTPLGRVPAYGWVREMKLTNNTIVGSNEYDLRVGGNYKSGYPRSQRFLLPEECHIANNLMIRTDGGVSVDSPEQDKNPPLDKFTFKPNHYENNVIFNGTVDLKPAAEEGFVVKREMPELVERADGIKHSAKLEEVNAGADLSKLKVLTPDDVGPEWVKARRRAGDPIFPAETTITDRER